MRHVVLFIGIFVAVFHPITADAMEVIHNFSSQIMVQPNGDLAVTEEITVNAEHDKIKHGIYRDLPRAHKTFLGRVIETEYRNVKVTVDNGWQDFRLEEKGSMLRIWIGDADALTSYGNHTYTINYIVPNQTKSKDGHDELTWNVTGNGWNFPIENVNATVILPSGAIVQDIQAYTGKAGAKGTDYTSSKSYRSASFENTSILNPHQGLTIFVSWPKGYVDSLSLPSSRIPSFLEVNPGFVEVFSGFFLICFFYFLTWKKIGRDPRAKALTPAFDPPPHISPAMAYQIMEMGVGDRIQALTAAIISLASKGYITIDEVEAKKYMITKTGKTEVHLLPEDELIICTGLSNSTLIGRGADKDRLNALLKVHADTVKSVCCPRFYSPNVTAWCAGLVIPIFTGLVLWIDLQEGSKPIGWSFLIGACAIAYAYRTILLFKNKSGKFWRKILTDMIIPLVLIYIFKDYLADIYLNSLASFLNLLMAFVGGGIIAAAFFLIRTPTRQGRDAMDHIAGLRYYMSMVEEKILQKFDPPEMSRELYEKYLPYACALGVDSKWGNKFALSVAGAAIAASGYYGPHWYSSSSGGSMDGFSMSSMMNDFSSSMAATSGGSGSGGGGGGGGGW